MSGSEGELRGRRALVTGAASGIGAACARALAAAGASVIAADIDAAGAERMAAELGGQSWAVDLSDTSSLTDTRVDVDVLVNNAGIQHVSPLEEFDPDRFFFMVRLMLEAPFLLVRAALPGMYERGFGRIINISSIHGLRASKYKAAYVSVKHGLEGLSKVTALEGGEHGVTSNCINPGYVRSPLVTAQIEDQARAHGIPTEEVLSRILLADSAVKRLVEPEEVADLARWLAGPHAGMVTGASYTMDGGWSAH